MEQMTFIDFFAGIGGFHSGLEQAGMKCIGWCEFDKFAQKSYRALYDTKGLFFSNDVRKIRRWDLPRATLWTFGFPCQDISIAGKQKGIKRGTKSGLFFEIMRLRGGGGAKTGLYKFIDLSKKNPQTTEHARCLTARYDRGISNRAGESSGVMAVLTPDRIEKRQNGRRVKEPGEPSFTVTAQDRHGIMIRNATQNNFGVVLEDGVGCCIRKLTPKECWRLQGFTDDQYEKASAVNSDTQLYKQAGNAVTVNVVREIGKHIVKLNGEMT